MGRSGSFWPLSLSEKRSWIVTKAGLLGKLEIFTQFLHLRHRSARLLIDLDNLCVVVLPRQHELLAESVAALLLQYLEFRIFLELLDPVSITQSVESGLAARQRR